MCIAGRAAATKALELGLSKGDPRVQFAQLKGMADVLSLSLAQGGFRVSKYLPFGPVREVIPYLIRRAEENRGLLGNTVIDRQMIRSSVSLAYIVYNQYWRIYMHHSQDNGCLDPLRLPGIHGSKRKLSPYRISYRSASKLADII